MDLTSENVMTVAETALTQISGFAVSYAFSILGALILIIVGFIIAGLVERWVNRALSGFSNFDTMLNAFLSKVARYAVLILVGVTVLAQFGVQTASIIAALGAAGLAIGLALQGTLQNIAAGIMLLALRPFRIGEYVDASGITGTIQSMGLFATELKTLDGLYLMAPNSELWNKPVINYSRNAQRRFDLTIGIGYNDDIDLAQKILVDLATNDKRVLDIPAPETFVSALGDSAVNVTVRYWTNTVDWWQTQLDLTKAGKKEFDASGITIPFPQRDVHCVLIEQKPEPKKPARRTTAKIAAKG